VHLKNMALSALVSLACVVPVTAQADEYFLDNAQKIELLKYGRITGRDEAQYDIWIVPGYVPPWRYVDRGWSAASDDLAEYGKPDYYDGMVDSTRKVMRFARKDVIREFALRGTRTAWRETAATAQQRVQRRVFGWWFAWPWALLEGSAQSVVRVGAGLPGGVLLWGGGGLLTPAGYMAWPAVMSAGHALGEGTLYPLTVVSWNTVIAPPLALAGQQPAPERADGWWMKRLQDPAEADIRALVADWQQHWQAAAGLPAMRQAQADGATRFQAEYRVLQEQLKAMEAQWAQTRAELDAGYQRVAVEQALQALPLLREDLAKRGYGPARLQAQREMLRAELVAQGLAPDDAERVLGRLLDEAGQSLPSRQPGDKTDPVKAVLENLPPR